MANPNKTVQKFRRSIGGFPERQRPPSEPWFDWMWEQMQKGRIFKSVQDAKASFEAEKK